MSTGRIDYICKVVIVGDSGVGKSSLMLQYTDSIFKENIQSTIGVDFKSKLIPVKSASTGLTENVKAIVWDTAGQERFRTLTSSFYRGANCVILVYDVTRAETFLALDSWLVEINQYVASGAQLYKVLVGNKIDLGRAVNRKDAEEWARMNSLVFVEVSAKSEAGVTQLFEEIAHKLVDGGYLSKSGSRKTDDQSKISSDNARLGKNVDGSDSAPRGCC